MISNSTMLLGWWSTYQNKSKVKKEKSSGAGIKE
jgi:hypothetical protein